MKNEITFTFKGREHFKLAAMEARSRRKETFIYEGVEIPTNYGVYLADYLEKVLPFPEYTGLTQPITINF